MTILWWHWLTLGFVLIGLELVVPSFTIIWFGLGAVIVSLIMALLPTYPLPAQLLTWSGASVILTVAWFRFFQPSDRQDYGRFLERYGVGRDRFDYPGH